MRKAEPKTRYAQIPGYADKEFLSYVARGNWKCDKSPTGAHHWFYADYTANSWDCVHCLEQKKFPMTLRYENLVEVKNV